MRRRFIEDQIRSYEQKLTDAENRLKNDFRSRWHLGPARD